MITEFWSKTKIYCAEHKEEMTLTLHSNVPHYECPVCHHSIVCYEFEKMMNHFQKMIVDSAKNDEEINLSNCEWKSKTAFYKVLEHSNDGLKVSVKVI